MSTSVLPSTRLSETIRNAETVFVGARAIGAIAAPDPGLSQAWAWCSVAKAKGSRVEGTEPTRDAAIAALLRVGGTK